MYTEKKAKIGQLQNPKTKKDVRKVLGLLNFYRKYVPNFADIATPLTKPHKEILTKQS